MSIDDILSDADRVERDHLNEKRRRAEEEAESAVRHIERILLGAREELAAYEPNITILGNVLQAFVRIRPKVNSAHRRRLDRAAAHILARASTIVDPTYQGPRSSTPMPHALPAEAMRRPAAPADDDENGGL